MTKRILITGANGLLGQKLVNLLTQQPDIDLIATARGTNRLPHTNGYTYQAMDITDRQQVLDVIAQTKPQVIIHTAAMTNVDQCESEKDACWAQNVTAVESLVDACQLNDAFLVHVSTDFIFDGKSGPYTEAAEPNPISFYGWSKYAAEKAVMNSPVRWAIARTVLVYGIAHDMSRTNIILWVKKSLEDGKTIKVVTDQWRSPTLAEDLAMGCFLIADKEQEGIFNISGKDFLTPYEMAIKTADYFQLNKAFITQADSTTFTQPARRPPRTGFTLDKAKTLLGYEPHSFEEGIAVLAGTIGLRAIACYLPVDEACEDHTSFERPAKMTLHIRVKAGSRIDQLFYDAAGLLTAKIKAPAQDGKANAYLVEYVAKQLGVAKSQVTLISGFTNPHKRLEIVADETSLAAELDKLR